MKKSKKRGPPEKASIKKILKAIPGTGGLKSAIAVKLGVHYRTILNYFVRIQDGDEDTCKWFLARKGKQRGYSEKIDTEQKIEGGIRVIFEDVEPGTDEDNKT
jgi:hypothetical protein